MIINVRLGANSYDIVLEKGALKKAGEYLNLNRKVLIVTDTGVPKEYAETVASCCKTPFIHTIEQGEANKTMLTVMDVCRSMMEHEFTRKDCVVAVGGGLVGDLAGFSASCYMRGIDFYNIPTTVLSQVDSSIGGKTAVNLDRIKNIVGAFYQPKKVIVDVDTLQTLSKRQIMSGLAEALKMSMNFDEETFKIFESGDPMENMELIIEKSLRIKEDVVSQDEKENGLRKVLNFGHTIGHGIEATAQELGPALYHGECVALGMIPMCTPEIRARLIPILERMELPTEITLPLDNVYEAMLHDKKTTSGAVSMVFCNKIGTFDIQEIKHDALPEMIRCVVKE